MSGIEPTHFYQDGSFWIALVALVTTLAKPFWKVLHRAKLSVEISPRFVVQHELGNPQVNMVLIIDNVGGHPLVINHINMKMVRDGKVLLDMNAQTFFLLKDPSSSMFFAKQKLEPGSNWNYAVVFYNQLSKEDEDAARSLIRQFRNDYNAQHDAFRDANAPLPRLIEINEKLVNEAKAFFYNHNTWTVGEYNVELSIDCTPSDASSRYGFHFVLYESDINLIVDSCEERYRYGFGVIPNFTDAEKAMPIPVVQDFRRI